MTPLTSARPRQRRADAQHAAGARRRTGRREARSAAVFIVPFGLLFAVFTLGPIVYAVFQSLFKVRRGDLFGTQQTTVFAGIDNFTTALRDGDFLSAVVRVLLLGLVQVPVMLGLALAVALLLDSRSARFRNGYRLVYFLPYALPGAVAAVMWSFLLFKPLSPFTEPLASLGIHTDFLSGPWQPFSIANMITWGWTGYNMLIIYSALQAIPGELTEAAVMDGCTGWRLALLIKVPLVKPALVLTTVFSIIGTSQLFTEPAVLNAARIPGANAKFSPLMNTTLTAAQGNQNLAAAESVLLALATLVLSFGFLKFTQRKAQTA
ncbi:carbohydrate ABC transporter permease [Kitasatospora cineracea]|uniref:Carbohydrate ABC transporter membrane protein 1 (CUT1 family) n=1 Tax=Kitasatospora cineracea TaxID=88074 RepID=A0A3N4RTH5_9ACTN|nr:sugar ABC transporter permease [Kitasatospora cineracea]RPE36166.1 carbohydrate ABC transporter membrane protein 1 (CUT1 family) [Kitasatospora cineracea]